VKYFWLVVLLTVGSLNEILSRFSENLHNVLYFGMRAGKV